MLGDNMDGENAPSSDEDEDITVIDEDDFNSNLKKTGLKHEPVSIFGRILFSRPKEVDTKYQSTISNSVKPPITIKTPQNVLNQINIPGLSKNAEENAKQRTWVTSFNQGNLKNISYSNLTVKNHLNGTFPPKMNLISDQENRGNIIKFINTEEITGVQVKPTPQHDLSPKQSQIAHTSNPTPVVNEPNEMNPQSIIKKPVDEMDEPKKTFLNEVKEEKEPVPTRNRATKTEPNNENLGRRHQSRRDRNSSSNSSSTTKTEEKNSAVASSANAKKPACLRNLGSTCYINVIIQVMRHTPGFVLSIYRLNKKIEYLKKLNSEIENEINLNSDIMFVRHLHELLVEMSEKEKLDRRPVYTPRKFVNAVWSLLTFWADGSQQDAHEFLQYTIHFINKCDEFIRELETKYKIKNIPIDFNCETKQSIDFIHSDIPECRFKKPRQKQSQSFQGAKNSKQLKDIDNSLPPPSSIPNPAVINEDSSSSSSSTWSNFSSNTTATSKSLSSSSSSTAKHITCPRQYPIRSAARETPEVVNSNETSGDYLRTPTKGGASSSSTLLIDTSITSSSSSPKSSQASLPPLTTHESYKRGALDHETDLVSRRLKETIKQSETMMRPVNSPKTRNEAKRMKRDDSSLYRELMSNDVIIIDDSSSEDEEARMEIDDVFFGNEDELSGRVKGGANDSDTNSDSSWDEMLNYYEKKLNVNLRCYVKLERVDFEKAPKIEPVQEPVDVIRSNNKPKKSSTRTDRKRFRSKSKTFPPDHQLASSPTPTIDSNGVIFMDIDSITPVASNTPFIDSGFSSAARSTRSSTSNLRNSIRVNYDESANECEVNKTPTRSPGELLRRRSNSLQASPCGLSPASTSAAAASTQLAAGDYTCEMDKLFRGDLVTVTQCLACETKREKHEEFYDRSIPVDDTSDNEEATNQEGKDWGGGENCWISKCLVNESYLNETSKYACDVCACKQEAKMHTQYTHMPPVLILHLLSYGYTSSHDGELNAQKLSNRSRLIDSFAFKCAQKTDDHVDIKSSPPPAKTMVTRRSQLQLRQQQDLQMQKQRQENNQQFKLFAVVMHSGQTLNSGHYTAFINYKIVASQDKVDSASRNCVKEEPNDSKTKSSWVTTTDDSSNLSAPESSGPEWLHFDDTKVESMSSSEFHRKIIDSTFNSPYILFYIRG